MKHPAIAAAALSLLPAPSRLTRVPPSIVTASSMGQQAPGPASPGNQVAP